jgi:hypothetical protein
MEPNLVGVVWWCAVFSNYSPYNVPKPGAQWSLMCEVSESAKKPVDSKTVLEDAEKGCIATKLISPQVTTPTSISLHLP